ncbi:MAG: hypothetical protein H7Y13_13690 [Sphingobacteriaceae bacterium]|nr:hypothetical protein [Sphingobacteriaceae bacterium]
MYKFLKYFWPITTGLIFIVVIFFIIKPLPVTRQNSIVFTAIATGVKQGGLNNLVLSFYNTRGVYSIAQADSMGLNSDTLTKNLVNKEVVVSYLKPGFFSHFHPMTNTYEVTQLQVGDVIVYSGFQDSP